MLETEFYERVTLEVRVGLDLVHRWLDLGVCEAISCQEDVEVTAKPTEGKPQKLSIVVGENLNLCGHKDQIIEHLALKHQREIEWNRHLIPMLLTSPADTRSSIACHVVSFEIVTSISRTPSSPSALEVVPTPENANIKQP